MDGLAQVETLLKGQDPEPTQRTSPPELLDNAFAAPMGDESILALPDLSELSEIGGFGGEMHNSFQGPTDPGAGQPGPMLFPPPQNAASNNNSQWDLISLGLEEPLPSPDVIEELYVIPAVLPWNLLVCANSRYRLGTPCSLKRYIQ